MEQKLCFKVRRIETIFFWFIILFMIFSLVTETQAQQFPIGTYWIKNPNYPYEERYDFYWQVADCGINIVVGGERGSTNLQDILDEADVQGIQLIIDHILPNNYIGRYGGGITYRLLYETDGYDSEPEYPDLVRIEDPILYSFSYEVGGEVYDGDATDFQAVQVLAPGTPGFLIHNYDGNLWQEGVIQYYATFRLKIDGNITQHTPVAELRIVEGTNIRLAEQIYSDDFTANVTYQDFEYTFYASTASSQSEESDYEQMLPTGTSVSPLQIDLDYQIDWNGQVTLWADYVAIEDYNGDRLFDGLEDNHLTDEANDAHSDDPDHDTILGFYNDEPDIFNIAPIAYVNNIIGPESPPALPNRAVINATIYRDYAFHQYLNTGLVENQDYKLLVDIYPIYNGDPVPGDPGYNNQLQYRWDHDLIPFIDDAAFVSSLNGRPFWYAAQAHSWDNRRDPYPIEIRAMVNLGLTYGAKAIFYFLYTSIPDIPSNGLVDENFNHNYEPFLSKWNEVQQINANLQTLAPTLLNLTWQEAHSIHDDPGPHQYISNIATTVDAPNETYLELGLFEDSRHDPDVDYFIVVNRRCEDTDNRTANVTIHKDASTYYFVKEMLSGDETLFQTNSSGDYVFSDNFNSGEGKPYMLKKARDGNVSGTWYEIEYVVSNATVLAGQTLTIEPGTIVKFLSSKELKINGTLNADGVKFTSFVETYPGYWNQLYFENANNSSYIRNSIIENAVIGVFCSGCSPTIGEPEKENQIQYNSSNGIKCLSASPTIHYNIIHHNGIGIFCQSNSHPYIKENYIEHNNSYGIYLTYTCNPYIRHNEISHNSGGGVACLNSSSPKLVGKSSSEPYGANSIEFNSGNGVLAMSSSNPNLGTHTSTKYLWAWAYNDIDGNSSKQVCNTTSNTIQAKKNWWGTPSPGPELFTGAVSYLPCLSDSSPYAGPSWGIATLLSTFPNITLNGQDEVEAYLAKAQLLEAEENYEEAVSAYRYVVDNYGDSEYGAFALARLMACRVDQGDITMEKIYVKMISSNYGKSEVGNLALLWQPLIEARSGDKQYALALCDSLRQTYSGSILARDAYFEKGTIQLYEMNDIEAAKQTFDEFARAYPNDLLIKHIEIMLSNYTPFQVTLPKPIVYHKNHKDNIVKPDEYTLSQNFPNPFNPETEIHYRLPEAAHVTLVIYNLPGQKIRTLIDRTSQAGYYIARWDGRDENGTAVASGVYFYVLHAGQFEDVKKMILMH